MPNILKIDPKELDVALERLMNRVGDDPCYFVPQAGNLVYDAMWKTNRQITRVEKPEDAVFIVDDIIDSGATFNKLHAKYPRHSFIALVGKNYKLREYCIIFKNTKSWVEIFSHDSGVEENVKRILQYIGEDVTREGLLDTPKRVMRSFDTLYGGYKMNPEEILKTTFTQTCDEMVMLKDIEFYSTCEHHMLPFTGKIHIAYLPSNKVVGISKLARLVECYARRLQIQERMVEQIADAIQTNLKPKGVMVVAEAQHLCMTSRGVQKQDSVMVTSAIRGAFKRGAPRTEFLNLIRR